MRFQVAVIDLAARGVPLTVANVVAHLRIDPDLVERDLDRMARDGRVDVEVDDTLGAVVYRVRGLSTTAGRSMSSEEQFNRFTQLQPIRPAAAAKSVTLAVLLAALFPGFGLAYVAPLRTVLVSTLLVIVFGKMFGASLLLGPLFWMTTVIISALLGGLYAVRFNQEGHRAPLYR